MDVNVLIIGLIAIVIGLIGIALRSTNEEYRKNSYTGSHFTWGTYVLLGIGVFLVIMSFC